MEKKYIFGYLMIAALLFGGILYWPHIPKGPKIAEMEDDFAAQVMLPNNKNSSAQGIPHQQEPSNKLSRPQLSEMIAPESQQTSQNNQPIQLMNAIFHTTKGDITIEFFGQDTPNTVTNFAKLAESGFYNGVKFHRVIKDFMLQGGDPLTKDDSKAGEWGTGGPGYRFNDEIGPNNRNAAGTISMANSGPNTNGSQFFINLKDNNFLDTKHTVFGRVVQGLDVVQAIGETLVGSNDRPVEPVIINNISLNQ